MSSLVAWSPVQGSDGPLIFSVLAHPENPLTLDSYLQDLSQRIQAMFDHYPVTEHSRLQSMLEQGGLLAGPLSVHQGQEAQMLVYSNPNIPNRLTLHGLPRNLRTMMPAEMLEARQQLQADKLDPQSRLEAWVSALGTMP